jgi:hypothetical protein
VFQICDILYCRWKKTSDNRQFNVERHDIRYLRVKYFRAIKADETDIHTSHTAYRERDDGWEAELKAPITKRQGLIIVHIGSSTLNSMY